MNHIRTVFVEPQTERRDLIISVDTSRRKFVPKGKTAFITKDHKTFYVGKRGSTFAFEERLLSIPGEVRTIEINAEF